MKGARQVANTSTVAAVYDRRIYTLSETVPMSRVTINPAVTDRRYSGDEYRSTGNALMAFGGAEHFQQRDRRGEWLNALAWTVRLIDYGYTVLCNRIHPRTMGDEIQNHLIVPTGGGVMKRCKTATDDDLRRA